MLLSNYAGRGMATNKKDAAAPAGLMDQARDELFSHILRCGVIEAEPEQQQAWIDDTMQYIAERYVDLGEAQLAKVRALGERFCQPVVRHQTAGSAS